MAPEVMVSGGATDKSYTYTADIWSVGCVVIGRSKTIYFFKFWFDL